MKVFRTFLIKKEIVFYKNRDHFDNVLEEKINIK